MVPQSFHGCTGWWAETPARNPNEQCVAVVQSSGKKGVNQFFCIWKAERGAGFKIELGVHFNPEIGDCWGKGDVGMLRPENVMLFMDDDLVWWGVPTMMASVLELFYWRKLPPIHTFISTRQLVSRDDDNDDNDDDGEFASVDFMLSA